MKSSRNHHSGTRRTEPLAGLLAVVLLLVAQSTAWAGTIAANRASGAMALAGDCCCVELVVAPVVEATDGDDCCADEVAARTTPDAQHVDDGCACHTTPWTPVESAPRASVLPFTGDIERELAGRLHANDAFPVAASWTELASPGSIATLLGSGMVCDPARGKRRVPRDASSPICAASMRGVSMHLALLSVARI